MLHVPTSPASFVPSPFKELEEIRQKRSKVKTCQKKKKYEFNSASTKVFMISEFWAQKENKENPKTTDKPQAQEEEQDIKELLENEELLKRKWTEESKKLNAMFKNVDDFEMGEQIKQKQEASPLKIETDAVPQVQTTPLKSTKRTAVERKKPSDTHLTVSYAKRSRSNKAT